MKKTKVGIVGCGKICGIYFKNITETFKELQITRCVDLDISRAQAKAAEYPGVKASTMKELLADPEVEIVVNLTIPRAHAEVAMQAVSAGKHVYSEKPLTLTREEGKLLLKKARARKLLVGNAPDTFMGAGIQTCRKLMDEGAIGTPIAASAFMMCHGHEGWHPDPEFYYDFGGGPMFDMGPYYLTALVNLMGPIKSVTGRTRITFPTRTITSEKKRGQIIKVKVPTHIAGIMDFHNGAIGTIVTSFDVWGHRHSNIEIYGSDGTLEVPNPNSFGGPVRWLPGGPKKEWVEVPLTHGYEANSRGIGVADMARAIRSGRAHRANGAMALHVLDVMHAFHESSDQGKAVRLTTTCERPAALPKGLKNGKLD